MARYTGPNNKKARRYRFSVLENNKEFIKGKGRVTYPGQHGSGGRPQKLSNYGEHLYEKQKLKYMYGVMEKQLKNTFKKSKKIEGVLGENFLFLLESRLDNLVFRMGLASTRRQARQIVNHGHILVNGKKVDIPSYSCKVGDEITLRERMRQNPFVLDSLAVAELKPFVTFDRKTWTGKFVRLPKREEISGQINEGLVVEFYNK